MTAAGARISPVSLALLLGFAAGGCATRTLNTSLRPEAVLVPPNATLVVVPFENLSAYRNAGLAVTDLAASVLYARGHFRLVDVSVLQDDPEVRFRRLETAPWERQLGVNPAAAAAIGRALKSDCVLAGSVGEFGFVDGFGETATVGITVRLVRSANAEVVWAGSLSRRASAAAFSDESAHRLAHEVLRELLGRMVDDLAWQQAQKARAEK